MPDQLRLSLVLPVSPDAVYNAWVDGVAHSAMTGAEASSEPRPGGACSAWDGYIEGVWLILEPGRRIVQHWRTTEFPPGAPDSRLELLLEPVPEGTRLLLHHTNLPDGDGERYAQGWEDYYFAPMREHFGG